MLQRRLFFIFSYLRRPPWESGIVPPEVERYIQTHPVGRALDLGCGSGTSSLALARAGWHVTGVDFIPAALRLAKHKALTARLAVDFRLADVTHLPPDILVQPFNLVLDVGCFHALSEKGQQLYLGNLPVLLASGGNWLVYTFLKPAGGTGAGMTDQSIHRAQELLALVDRRDGLEKGRQPSAWLTFTKG